MKIRRHVTISLALTALALGMTTTQALAQQTAMTGSFDLPRAAYFGDTLLQSGHYRIWMSTDARNLDHVPAIHLSGEGVTKIFLTISKPKRESGRTYLEIAGMDGTYVVRALDAGTLGRSFSFGVTKNVRKRVLEAHVGPTIAVPVSLGTNF
jgi:hypothetical protein